MSVVMARSGGQPGLSTTVVRGILSSASLRLAGAVESGRGKTFLGEQRARASVFLGFYDVPCQSAAEPCSRAARWRGGGVSAWSLANYSTWILTGRAVEKTGRARVSAWSGPHTPTTLHHTVRACTWNTK